MPGDALMLEAVETELPEPGPREILLRQEAIGVNFIDVYYRTGLYRFPNLPAVLGVEGAGVVEAVGAEVTSVQPGDCVAYGRAPLGAYASKRLSCRRTRAIRIPNGLEISADAAAILVRGHHGANAAEARLPRPGPAPSSSSTRRPAASARS